MKKKKSNNLASEFILEDTEQTARMKEMALSDAYSCSGEMYKLLSYEVMHNLVKKIKKGEVKLKSDLVYGKDVITTEEKFLENLDHYIGYTRDNYLIEHHELLCLIELSLGNKYSEVLFSLDDIHCEEGFEFYYSEFRKMFINNFYENVFYFGKVADSNSFIRRFVNEFEDHNFDSNRNIKEIEKVFKKIVSCRNNNLFNSFVPNKEYNDKNLEFYYHQIEWVLSDYYGAKDKTLLIDKTMLISDFTYLTFDITSNVKTLKNNDDLMIRIRIKNKWFDYTTTAPLMKKRELFELIQSIKDTDRHQPEEIELSFLNADLRFSFWGSDSDKNMDLMLDIYDDNAKFTGDMYSLSFNEERMNVFLYLLESQINI
ncbi:MAG: hypothetical protein IKJ03_00435 [Mycoplasmataceae bacterium]|nr:hypothetical protein [Mycoplasmataceae bacterium]